MPRPNGARIRAERKRLRIKPKDFAAKIPMKGQYLANIESGHAPKVGEEVLGRIADELGLSLRDVIADGGEQCADDSGRVAS